MNMAIPFQLCCDAGLQNLILSSDVTACPTYSYSAGVCSVSPYNENIDPSYNYGTSPEDCCRAGFSEACDEQNFEIIEEMVCEKEVYEPTSETCDLVTAVR